MRVLFLTNIPSPYRVEFFNELGKLCDLTVLYELEAATDRNLKWNANNNGNFKEVFLNGVKVGKESALSFSVIKYLNSKEYDIIVIGGYSTPTGMLAIEFLRMKKIPFILNCDGGIVKNDHILKYRFKKHFIGSASAYLCTGNNTKKYIINYGGKLNNIYIYPFTSVKEKDIIENIYTVQEKEEIRNKLSLSGKRIIVSVGQFIYRKGFDILIESMKLLPSEYSVYIIGGIPTEEYIELKEKNKLDNLFFVEFLTKEELKEYYIASDLFVLPTREDIWGLVINEAMAIGLPVITTNKCVAGLELIKDDINGYIIPIEDSIQLANKITDVLDNEELLNKISLNNIKLMKEYTIENMAKKHYEIFRDFLGRI